VYCVRLGMMISGSFFAQTLIENFDFTIDLFGFQNFDEGCGALHLASATLRLKVKFSAFNC